MTAVVDAIGAVQSKQKYQMQIYFLKLLIISLFVLTTARGSGEPELDSLIERSKLIIVAEPIYKEGRGFHGKSSGIVVYGFNAPIKVSRILKSDGKISEGDELTILINLFLDDPIGDRLRFGKQQKMILFLMEEGNKKKFLVNSSTWFGVQEHTRGRELLLAQEIQMLAERGNVGKPSPIPDSESETQKSEMAIPMKPSD